MCGGGWVVRWGAADGRGPRPLRAVAEPAGTVTAHQGHCQKSASTCMASRARISTVEGEPAGTVTAGRALRGATTGPGHAAARCPATIRECVRAHKPPHARTGGSRSLKIYRADCPKLAEQAASASAASRVACLQHACTVSTQASLRRFSTSKLQAFLQRLELRISSTPAPADPDRRNTPAPADAPPPTHTLAWAPRPGLGAGAASRGPGGRLRPWQLGGDSDACRSAARAGDGGAQPSPE